jgi:hypothetical protein
MVRTPIRIYRRCSPGLPLGSYIVAFFAIGAKTGGFASLQATANSGGPPLETNAKRYAVL